MVLHIDEVDEMRLEVVKETINVTMYGKFKNSAKMD